MMEPIQLIEIALGTAVIIIGFFLKTVHADLKKSVEDIGKLKGKVALIEQSANDKIDKLAQITELQIQQLTENIKELNASIVHMNNNMKTRDITMAKFIKELKDELKGN